MRYLIVSIIILFGSSSLNAKFIPDSLLNVANNHYIEGKFDEAAELYQTLVDSGYHNAELYYNLGNSYFKLGKPAYAILNYERAHRLKPNDEDIEFNLEYARSFTVDRIEPLPVFFLVKWYRSVRGILSTNGWAWISLFWFAVALTLGLVFWFSFRPWTKRLSFTFGIMSILFAVFSVIFSVQEKERVMLRDEAIIFQPVVTVKSSPGEAGKEIFIIHSGTKVQITKAIGQWVEIRIADGNKGWIPSETLELI
ncbi:MAG: tetratricopeptide repeat protein [Bacteroidales bacterium]|jgi:tetratricopeptide (TPR) repeat protein|nr:tetratricopeptide repeat protein [Bacteroidales bacterium]MDY0252820.1 tetratricopeptide repeat protein [Tenuifilaceae bacterium]